MPKVGSLIEKLLKKAGVELTEELKPVTVLDAELSDEVFNKVDKGLLTIEAAKNNSEVKKHYNQQILHGADLKIEELIVEHGLHPGEDFLQEQSTYEKIVKLTKLALEAGKKASGATSKTTADEFAKKEEEYNRQLKELKETISKKEKEFNQTIDENLTGFELQKILLTKDYVFPKEMDNNVKVNTALAVVTTELNKKGFRIKRNESGQLQVVNMEGNKAYSDTNEEVNPTTFIDGALAQNKLLKINDTTNQQHPLNVSNGAQIPFSTTRGNQAIVNEFDRQLAEMK